MAFSKKINSQDGEPLLSARKVAARLSCAQDYVGKLCREGKLRGNRIGNAWFVEEESVREFEITRELAKAARSEELSRKRREENEAYRKARKMPEQPSDSEADAPTPFFSLASRKLSKDNKPLLSARKVAARLSCAQDYVGKLCREGKLRGNRIGNAWFVEEESVREFEITRELAKAARSEELSRKRREEGALHQNTAELPEEPALPQRSYFSTVSTLKHSTLPFGVGMALLVVAVVFAGGARDPLVRTPIPAQELTSALAQVDSPFFGSHTFSVTIPSIAPSNFAKNLFSSLASLFKRNQVEPVAVLPPGKTPTEVPQVFEPPKSLFQPSAQNTYTTVRTTVSSWLSPEIFVAILSEMHRSLSGDIDYKISRVYDSSIFDNGGGGGSGSVTSVDISGGTTGFSFSGGPITSSGIFSMSGVLAVVNGGTGISSAPNYGQLLVGDGAGGYSLLATSSLGITAGSAGWGQITGTLSDQTDLQNALDAKLSLTAWYATTTDALDEGVNNLYFTNARVADYINSSSTIPNSEGTAYGDVLIWDGSTWVTTATSSLGLGGGSGNSFAYPFPNNATSTTLTFSGGLVSVGSTTINGNATTTGMQGVGSLFIDNSRFTSLLGSGLQNLAGVLTLDTSGDWQGTFDGQEGSYYLANSFSTTSAQYFVHSSTTIPKTYTANTWTDLQTLSVGFISNASSTVVGGFTVAGTATTTNLAIASVTSSLLKTNSLGQVVAAVAGTDYATPSSIIDFKDWHIVDGYLTPTTTLGIIVNASSTIGSGTGAGGLTIHGGATTTGNAYFAGNVGIGTTSPYAKLSVVGETVAAYFTATTTTASQFPYASSTALTVSGTGYFSTASTTNLRVSGTQTFENLSSGGLAVNSLGNVYTFATTTWTFASSTLLGDNNTFSGINNFTNPSSNFGGTWQGYSPGNLWPFPGNATTTELSFNGGLTAVGATTTALAVTGSSTISSILNVGGALNANSALTVLGNTTLGQATSTHFAITNLPSALLTTNALGSVVASSTLSQAYGGTGIISYTEGDILYANSSGVLSKLPIGSTGQVLKVEGGLPSWGTDVTSGGSEGLFSTTTDSLAIHPSVVSRVFLLGATATSTTGNILEVLGSSLFRGTVVSYNTLTAPSFTATSSVASQFPYASTTMVTATTASTTKLVISSLGSQAGECLTTDSSGTVTSQACGSGGGAEPFPGNATTTTLTFSNGLLSLASTTIGSGAQAGGLTIHGGATTTGNAYFAGNVGIGTTSPYAKLSVVGETVAAYFTATTTTASQFPYASSTALTVSGTGYFSTASTTNLRVSGTQTFENLSSGGLAVNSLGNVYTFATTTWTFASSTLLGDNNTFSGINNFTNPSSNFGGTWQGYSPGNLWPFPGNATTTELSFNGGLTAVGATTTALAVTGSSTISSILNVGGALNANSALTVLGNTTLGQATSTNFAISSISSGSLLKTTTGGAIIAAVAGTDYANFAYPFPNNSTSTLLTFSGGLLSLASTTIGSGAQAGGITIHGGATTTGNTNFLGTLSVTGASTLSSTLSVSDLSTLAGFLSTASSTINGNLVVVGNATTAAATTTNLAISNITSSLLKTTSGGSVIPAVAGIDYVTPGGLQDGRDWELIAGTYLRPTSTVGIIVSASSTIGNGGASGLTVNGTATTTNLVISGVTSALLSTNSVGRVGNTTVSSPLSFNAGILSIQEASASQNGYLSSVDWTLFNNKISSTSLSGASVISYNSSTGVITTTPGTFAGTSASVYTFPGDLIVTGNATATNATTTNLYVSASVRGAGLTSCSSAADKLLWNATTGQFTCATDAGASGSTEINWTYFNGSGVRVSTSTNQVLIGHTSTSTLSKLEVVGGATFDSATTTAFHASGMSSFGGNVGLGTTSPYQKLSVAGGNILQVASGNPTLASSTATGGQTYNTHVVGRYAYVASNGSGQGLKILDISNPKSPVLLSTYSLNTARDVVVSGRYAYVADANTGLHIVDVSNPNTPTAVGTYSISGSSFSIALSGKYVFINDFNNAAVRIIDISNPASPTLAGSIVGTNPNAVVVAGKYAYVADFSPAIDIYDVSNPAKPTLVGSYNDPGTVDSPIDMFITGRHLYVADASLGLYILNVANPASPTLSGTYDPGGTASFYGVMVAGNYAYLAEHGTGEMVVLDVTLPANPTLVGSYNTGTTPQDVFVSGKYAYVATEESTLAIIDINGATLPAAHIGALESNALSVTDDINVGGEVFVGGGLNVGVSGIFSRGGLSVFGTTTLQDFTGRNATTTNATSTNFFATTASSTNLFTNIASLGSTTLNKLTVSGNATTSSLAITGVTSSLLKTNSLGQVVAAVAGTDYATTGTISSFANWQLTGGYLRPTTTVGIIVSASSTIGSGTQAGGLTISGGATTTGNAYFAGNVGIGTTSPIAKLALVGGSMYQAGGDGSSSLTLSLLSSVNIGADVGERALVVSGKYAYIAVTALTGTGCSPSDPSGCELRIYNVSTSSATQFVGGADIKNGSGTNVAANGVIVAGRYAYVVTNSATGNCVTTSNSNGCDFRIFDVSNPSNPVLVGGADVGGQALEVRISGRYAYVASAVSGAQFRIYDISNPTNPTLVNTFNMGVTVQAMFIEGNYAYVAALVNASANEFRVFDISNPMNIVEVGGVEFGANARSVFVQLPYAYVGKADGGITEDFIIYDVSNPTSVATTTGIDVGFAVLSPYITGRYAYVGVVGSSGQELRVYDVSDPYSIVQVAGAQTGNRNGNATFVQGNRVYLGLQDTGSAADFIIYDITGIEAQSVLAHAFEAGNAFIRNNLYAGRGYFSGLQIEQGGINSRGPLSVYTASSTATTPISASFMGGNVGIGTTSPWGKLSVTGSGTGSGAAFVVADSANTPRFVVHDNGNVGIGTTSPYAKLSVVGETVAAYFTATTTTASQFPYASSTALTVSGTGYFSTASTTNLRVSGTQTFENLSSGGLAVNSLGNVYTFATTTWTFASSTLLGDNNTFSGINNFTNPSSNFGGTWQGYSPGNLWPFPGNATTTELSFNGGLTAVGATTTALAVTGSSTISSILNVGGALNANSALTVLGNTTLGQATSTNFAISSISSGSLLKTTTGGAIIAAVAGTDYANFAYPFPNNSTSTLLTFSGGLLSLASTTIGSGAQAGGITIHGGATTTGNAYFAGNVGIGTTSPFAKLSIHANSGETNKTLFAIASSTASATTTLFSISNTGTTTLGRFGSCSGSSALTTDSSGNIVCGAVTGDGVGKWFVADTFGSSASVSTSTLTGFTAGLYSLASSTIGSGTGAGGLTIHGGATTTGNAYFAGNVGIGTTSPWGKLSVTGSGTGSGAAFVVADSANTPRFVVHDSGNVGIATTTSGWKLLVEGNSAVIRDVNNSSFMWTQNYNSGSSAYSEFLSVNHRSSLVSLGIGSQNTTSGVYADRGYVYAGGVSGGGFSNGLSLIAASSSADIRFFTGGDTASHERVRINSSGQLLISDGSAGAPGLAFLNNTDLGIFRTGSDGIAITTAGASKLNVGPTALSFSTQTGTVSLDSTTSSTTVVAGGENSLTWEHTVGSGSDRILIVGVSKLATGAVESVTYGGSPLTLLQVSSRTSARAEVWYMVNPPTGTADVVVTLPGATVDRMVGGSASFAGVNQTTPFGTPATASGSSLEASVSVGSATGDLVVSVLSRHNSGNAPSNGSGQTSLWNATTGAADTVGNRQRGLGSSKFADSGTITMSYTWTTTNRAWALVGVSVKPASAASSLATRFLIDQAGNTGIGTTSPWGKLSVTGSGTGSGAAFVVADSANTPRFVVHDNGNVGIGTTSPYAKLSVVGETVAAYFTATTTTASQFPYASSTALTVSGTGYFSTASTTNLRVSGTQTFENLSSGGLAVNSLGNVYTFATTTWTFASSTLLGDNNTFSGINNFTNPSSNFGGTWQGYSPGNLWPFPGNATTTELSFNGGLTAVGATTTALAVTGSSTISSILNVGGALNANSALTVLGNTTLGQATSTNFAISSISSGSLLKTTTGGAIIAAVAGTDYANFAYPFPNNSTSTLLTFSGGLLSLASTTIGSGAQAGGITIHGGATTTGNAYFAGNVGIGTTSPFAKLSIHANSGETNKTLFAIASSTASATTTLFSISNTGTTTLGRFGSCSGSSALTTDSSGNIVCGAVTGDGVGKWFVADTFGSSASVSTSTLTGFTAGLYSLASSTIGSGTGAGGLTIHGGATTTGNAYFAGNVGIGTTSPWGKLSVTGSGTGSGAAFVVADSANTPRFVVHDSGNVGIATTTSGWKLLVEGNSAVIRDVNNSSFMWTQNYNSGSSAYSEFLSVNHRSSLVSLGIGSQNTTSGVYADRGYVYAGGVSGGGFSNGLSLIAASSSADIRFFTGGDTASHERVRINSSGQLLISDGSAGAPGLAFLNNTDLGIFRTGSDGIAITTAGASKLNVGPTALSFSTQTGTVSLDSTTSSTTVVAGGENSLTWEHTVGSGSDRILIVGVSKLATGAVESVTYGGSPLTLLQVSSRTSARAEVWYMVNPPTGTADVVVTLPGATVDRMVGGSASFAGVNQTTPFGTPATASGSSLEASVSVGSATGDLVVSVLSRHNSGNAPSNGSGQTSLWNATTGAADTVGNRQRGLGSSKFADSGTITMSYTWTTTNRAWALVGVSVKPASAASSLATRFLIDQAGNTGIGTTSPWRTLSLNGTAAMQGLTSAGTGNYLCQNTTTFEITSGTSCSLSSERFKENIVDLNYGLDDVLAMRAVSFTFKEEMNMGVSTQLGFIAEEIEKVVPELVTYDKEGRPAGVNYSLMTALLTKALQEMNLNLQAIATTTASSTNSSRAFADSFFANLFARLTSWLADAGNGIANLFAHTITATVVNADTVNAKTLCLEGVCITKSQLENLLGGSGIQAASASQSSNTSTSSATSTGDTDAPTITVLGNNPASVAVGATYQDAGITIEDNVDQNLGYMVSVDGGEFVIPAQLVLDTSSAGEHTILYRTIDNAGNVATAERIVIVGDAPQEPAPEPAPESLSGEEPAAEPEPTPES